MEIFQTLTLGSVILVRIWVGRISTKVDAATEQLRQLTDPESGIPVRLARLEGELQQISSLSLRGVRAIILSAPAVRSRQRDRLPYPVPYL